MYKEFDATTDESTVTATTATTTTDETPPSKPAVVQPTEAEELAVLRAQIIALREENRRISSKKARLARNTVSDILPHPNARVIAPRDQTAHLPYIEACSKLGSQSVEESGPFDYGPPPKFWRGVTQKGSVNTPAITIGYWIEEAFKKHGGQIGPAADEVGLRIEKKQDAVMLTAKCAFILAFEMAVWRSLLERNKGDVDAAKREFAFFKRPKAFAAVDPEPIPTIEELEAIPDETTDLETIDEMVTTEDTTVTAVDSEAVSS